MQTIRLTRTPGLFSLLLTMLFVLHPISGKASSTHAPGVSPAATVNSVSIELGASGQAELKPGAELKVKLFGHGKVFAESAFKLQTMNLGEFEPGKGRMVSLGQVRDVGFQTVTFFGRTLGVGDYSARTYGFLVYPKNDELLGIELLDGFPDITEVSEAEEAWYSIVSEDEEEALRCSVGAAKSATGQWLKVNSLATGTTVLICVLPVPGPRSPRCLPESCSGARG